MIRITGLTRLHMLHHRLQAIQAHQALNGLHILHRRLQALHRRSARLVDGYANSNTWKSVTYATISYAKTDA